jgi:hypothetical protein
LKGRRQCSTYNEILGYYSSGSSQSKVSEHVINAAHTRFYQVHDIPHHCETFPLLHPSVATMSQNPPTADSSSNYQVIFDNALKYYQAKTGKDLKSDPLLRSLETCNSPDAVLILLRRQIPGFDQSGSRDERLTNWVNPVVNVLYNFAETIDGAVGLVSLDKFILPRPAL